MEKYFIPERVKPNIPAESGEKEKAKIANIGYYEKNGQILARDLQILIDDKLYTLEVGTQAYVDSLAKIDPPLEEDYNTLVMEDVTDLEVVYSRLRELPKKKLLFHLHSQDEEISTSEKSKQKLPSANFSNPSVPEKKTSNADEFYKVKDKKQDKKEALKTKRRKLYSSQNE